MKTYSNNDWNTVYGELVVDSKSRSNWELNLSGNRFYLNEVFGEYKGFCNCVDDFIYSALKNDYIIRKFSAFENCSNCLGKGTIPIPWEDIR